MPDPYTPKPMKVPVPEPFLRPAINGWSRSDLFENDPAMQRHRIMKSDYRKALEAMRR